MSVTYSDVEQAIAELLEDKKSLTLANLRQALGDRGSMSTLSKYLQQWKGHRYLDSSKNAPPPAAPPAPDTIFSAVQSVWQQMQGIGQQQLAEKEADFIAQQNHWIEKEAILKSIVEKQDQSYQDLSAQKDSLALHYQQESQSLTALQGEHQLALQQIQDLQQEQKKSQNLFESTLQDLIAQNLQVSQNYQSTLKSHLADLDMQKKRFDTAMLQSRLQFEEKYQALEDLYQKNQMALALWEQKRLEVPQIHDILMAVSQLDSRLERNSKDLTTLVQNSLQRALTLEPAYPSCKISLTKRSQSLLFQDNSSLSQETSKK